MGASDAASGRLAIHLAKLYPQSQLPTARLPLGQISDGELDMVHQAETACSAETWLWHRLAAEGQRAGQPAAEPSLERA
jgi:hypothetical protein